MKRIFKLIQKTPINKKCTDLSLHFRVQNGTLYYCNGFIGMVVKDTALCDGVYDRGTLQKVDKDCLPSAERFGEINDTENQDVLVRPSGDLELDFNYIIKKLPEDLGISHKFFMLYKSIMTNGNYITTKAKALYFKGMYKTYEIKIAIIGMKI